MFITIMQNIKQNKLGNHNYPLSFETFPKDTELILVVHLETMY